MLDPSIRYCHLGQTAVISVSGPDSRDFLHAMLTQDIVSLTPEKGAHAAWLDPKGRVRALFEVILHEDGFWLLTPRQTAEAVVKKIQLFILRAKVQFEIDDSVAVFALLGDASDWLLQQEIALAAQPCSVSLHVQSTWLRVGPELVRVVGQDAVLSALLGPLNEANEAAVSLAEIALGLPSLTPELEASYTPHMLSLDYLGAIAFAKGCYPGQEIVARTENLGTVKRRAQRFQAKLGSPPDIGTVLIDSGKARVGEVIRSAPCEPGFEILAVVRLNRPSGPIFVDGNSAPLSLKKVATHSSAVET